MLTRYQVHRTASTQSKHDEKKNREMMQSQELYKDMSEPDIKYSYSLLDEMPGCNSEKPHDSFISPLVLKSSEIKVCNYILDVVNMQLRNCGINEHEFLLLKESSL